MVKFPMDMVIVMSQVSFICPSLLLSLWSLRVSPTSENNLFLWCTKIPQSQFTDLISLRQTTSFYSVTLSHGDKKRPWPFKHRLLLSF